MGLATFPVALLLFGASLKSVPALTAAGSARSTEPVVEADSHGSTRVSLGDRRWLLWLLVPGFLASMYVAGIDVSIQQAYEASDYGRVEELVGMLPADPVLADIVAQSWQGAGRGQPMPQKRRRLGLGPSNGRSARWTFSPTDRCGGSGTRSVSTCWASLEACADVGSSGPSAGAELVVGRRPRTHAAERSGRR